MLSNFRFHIIKKGKYYFVFNCSCIAKICQLVFCPDMKTPNGSGSTCPILDFFGQPSNGTFLDSRPPSVTRKEYLRQISFSSTLGWLTDSSFFEKTSKIRDARSDFLLYYLLVFQSNYNKSTVKKSKAREKSAGWLHYSSLDPVYSSFL